MKEYGSMNAEMMKKEMMKKMEMMKAEADPEKNGDDEKKK